MASPEPTPDPVVVECDSRRRVSLAKIGNPAHRYYMVEAGDDGTIRLTPAVIIPASLAKRSTDDA